MWGGACIICIIHSIQCIKLTYNSLEAELAGVRTIMQRLHNSSARLLRLSPRSSVDACEQASPLASPAHTNTELRASSSTIPRRADVRITPLLQRGGEAMDKLGRLSERVAALRDRLAEDN